MNRTMEIEPMFEFDAPTSFDFNQVAVDDGTVDNWFGEN